MLALTLVLSLLIGISLGVLGGGGSILTVPILVYVLGMPPKEAIATSLFVVGITSAAGAVSHARAGRVRWRTGLLFGVAGMTGAYAGGRIAAFIPGSVLLVAFALMMFATAAAMLKKRAAAAPTPAVKELRPVPVLFEGLAVGLVTGLVGAGGGFLVVPALALLGGLPMNIAVGTSLLIIAMKSGAGLVGYLHSVDIDWAVASMVAGTAVIGSFLGGRLVGYLSEHTLRRAFGWFVVGMGVLVLGKQAPAALLTNPLVELSAALLVIVGSTFAARRMLARRRTPAVELAEEAEPAESGL